MYAETLQELAALKACGRHSWPEIARHLGVSWQAARSHWRRKCRDLEPGPCPICGTDGTEDRSSWSEQGNYAEASAHGPRIKSLDHLLEAAEVDLDTWQIRDWGVKKWEVGAKIELGELEFDKGRISGHLSKQGLGVQDLWSVWAKFIRREPIAILPAVQPVACPISYEVPKAPPSDRVKGALLISDLHIGYARDIQTGKLVPFHDRRAIDAVLQLAATWLFEFVAIAGDLLDLTNFNQKYVRSPEFYFTTQPSILEAHWILHQLRQLQPNTPIAILAGNHENRIKRSLEKHLIEAYGLHAADELHLPPALSPARLLALHQLGIEYIDEYPAGEVRLGPLRVTHGEVARKPPGASARAVVEDSQCDSACGHTHRLEMVSKRIRVPSGSKVIKSMSTGCLCHCDGRVPPHGSPEQWQQGFAVVSYTDEAWSPTLVSIEGGRAIVDGLELNGQDYTPRLRADLPDWNWGE